MLVLDGALNGLADFAVAVLVALGCLAVLGFAWFVGLSVCLAGAFKLGHSSLKLPWVIALVGIANVALGYGAMHVWSFSAQSGIGGATMVLGAVDLAAAALWLVRNRA